MMKKRQIALTISACLIAIFWFASYFFGMTVKKNHDFLSIGGGYISFININKIYTILTDTRKISARKPDFEELDTLRDVWRSRGFGGWRSVWLPRIYNSKHRVNENSFRIIIPLWIPFFITAIPAYKLYRKNRINPGHCKCGYNLTGNVSGVCPECGIHEATETLND